MEVVNAALCMLSVSQCQMSVKQKYAHGRRTSALKQVSVLRLIKFQYSTLRSDFRWLRVKQRTLLLGNILTNMQDSATEFHSNLSYSNKNEKLIYPAATRNQEPILQVLKRFIFCDGDISEGESAFFLEISSGSGQHVFHFAPHFPTVKFQPTEVDPTLLGSIAYYAEKCPTKNINKPMLVDIQKNLSEYGFKENSVDYLYNANMMHISPYGCTIGLFENAGKYLKEDALMITYGPYSKDGVITPESNVKFHESLKARDPSWGLRDITDLIKLAEQNNLALIDTIEMPANNFTLIWKRN